MHRYENYKPSGIQWLGDMPSSWNVMRNIGIFDERKQINSVDMELLSVTINRGVIKQDEITSKKDSSNEDKSKYKVVQQGDLAYNKMRMWQGAIGVSNYDGIVSPAYVVLRPRNKLYSRYFHYLYRTDEFIAEANRHSYGLCLDMNSLRYEDFKTIYSPLPPEADVERIVFFLDQKTAEINTAIAKKERLIELLNEQKSILINQAVTRGLNPDVPMRDSGIEWLGKVPAHWPIKRIKHISRQIVDGAHFTPTYVNEGVPFLRVTDISAGQRSIDLSKVKRIPEKEHKILCKRARPEKGDVLLSKNGTIGETIVVDWDFEFSIFVSLCLIKLAHVISPQFFCLYFSSPVVDLQLAKGGKRTSVTNLHLDKIKELILVLPPIDEQRSILQHIDSTIKPYDLLVDNAKNEILALVEFKQILIAHTVTGKIKV